jgi:glycosyltransferase involved in cell wall biosynthesis
VRIAIATDAWYPQVNGVVTTLEKVGEQLETLGHRVLYVTPEPFLTIPCPSYRSIHLALFPGRGVARLLQEFNPDRIHIATEGPVGLAARAYCLRHGLRFTTSYHTQFPEYLRLRAPIPIHWTYAWLRRFHGFAQRILVPTPSQQWRLIEHGFPNVVVWSRGVDAGLFRPRPKGVIAAPRPVSMYVGRIAVEKNIEAFLSLDLPGSKFVVGDGPALPTLRRKYPEVYFVGYKRGRELATYLADADVFVFPSRTDTFGLVLLEAMACGVPVAAYPVTGPIDVVVPGETGVLSEDLRQAVLKALKLESATCVEHARAHSWQRCAEVFLFYLEPNPK